MTVGPEPRPNSGGATSRVPSGLESFLNTRRRLVDEALARAFVTPVGPAARLHEAMEYSLKAGGKRIRPILVIAAAEACGAPAERVLPAALAMEFLHTYSLIHDDLPCMDNDDLRRGKPTNHKVYGETIAVLAGDGLQAEAFRLMAENGRVTGVSPAAAVEAALLFAEAAGPRGMVGGQAVDWMAEGREVGESDVVFIHAHKTGALIRAAVVCGGILGGATSGQRVALEVYGERLGLLFQIVDDILNVEGDTMAMGKATGSDQVRKKATFPAVAGLPAAKRRAESLLGEARAALLPFGAMGGPLGDLAEYVLTRKS